MTEIPSRGTFEGTNVPWDVADGGRGRMQAITGKSFPQTIGRGQLIAQARMDHTGREPQGLTPRAGATDVRVGARNCACSRSPLAASPPPAVQAHTAQELAAPIAATQLGSATPLSAAPAATTPAAPQAASTFRHKKSTWTSVAGRASESPVAREAYAFVQQLAQKYPTADALKAAGWKPHNGSTSHYAFPGFGTASIWAGGGAHFALAVIDDQGRVTGAQIDGHREYNDPNKPPPNWSGVQWHYHDDKSAPWMAHVDITRPIDQAFVEHGH